MNPSGERNTGPRRWSLLIPILVWEFGKSVAKGVGRVLRPRPALSPPPPPPSADDQRSRDRNLEPQRETAAHLRHGTLLVASAFAVALAAGVGFLYVYWTGANHMLLGATLALFWGGLGVSLVLYARWLMLDIQADEPREILPSSAPERDSLAADFYGGASNIRRRGLLTWIAVAAVGFVTSAVLSLFRSLGTSTGDILFSTVWKRGQRLVDADGRLISIHTLEPGSTIVAFPENDVGNERAQTMLVRVEERLMADVPQRRADWSPMGYFAYSRVCTHAGCPVGLFEVTTCLLMCPCHQSTFDVLRGAQPTSGPAARPLPQLPLYVDADGMLHAGGGFTTPPGPGFWGMPPSPPPEETS
jgi:ubiquinol-cytochrome c reductase iron-sulfur subunit